MRLLRSTASLLHLPALAIAALGAGILFAPIVDAQQSALNSAPTLQQNIAFEAFEHDLSSMTAPAPQAYEKSADEQGATPYAPLPDSAKSLAKVVKTGGEIIIDDLKESVADGLRYLVRPAHFDAADWATFGGTLAVTGVSIAAIDQPVRTAFQTNKGVVGDAIAKFGNFFGTGALGGAAAATLYTTGLLSGDDKVRLMGRHIVQVFAYSGLTTTLLKYAIGRERPYTNDGPHKFHGFSTDDSRHSLPSGHTTVATAICSSLAADLDNMWTSIGLYTIAATTVFARMYADQHWLSDTFLGGVIGTATGYWVVHAHRDDQKDGSLLVVPTGEGLTAVWKF